MMRILLLGVLVLIAFGGTIAGMLAMSGNLNQETLMRLIGQTEEAAPEPQETADEMGPLVQRLQAERERLEERAAELDEREEKLNMREQRIDELLNEVSQRQEQLAMTLDELDTDRQTRVEQTAKKIEAMDSQAAAETLAELPPEEAVDILFQIKDRNAGKILDEMDPLRRNLVVEVMQERKY